MRKIAFTLLLFLPLLGLAAEEDLLPPDQAFRFTARALDADTVRAEWSVADGYYLYRNKLRFTTDTAGIELGEPAFPAGKKKQDEFFGEVEIYRGKVRVDLPLRRTGTARELSLVAHSQGCADMGVCYPPHRHTVAIKLPAQAAASTPAQPTMKAAPLGNLLPAFGPQDDEVLDPEVAFRVTADALDGNTILARFEIAPKHYLYRDKLTFSLKEADGVALGSPEIPPGEEKDDEFFGRIQVFHDGMEVRVPVARQSAATRSVEMVIGYQGCAEAGICYPPQKKTFTLDLPAGGPGDATPVAARITPTAPAEPLSEQDSLAASLASGNTAMTVLTFFGLGLLLAFTPCVFPMIPILSSIIVGQGTSITTRRAFTLSLVYVLAMALTYTVAGVVAGLFGANLQATFQNPWILGAFAAVFVALALSMFGFFELQLPSSLQSRITALSNRQQGGNLTGVAVMGLLSALIVGPCVAPPLMGALIYIGQTGDAMLGGAALFALSLGMGAPLLAVGVSAGKFLPRAGGWMDTVKAVFGVLMLAVAVWMLERILPAAVTMVLWALLFIVPAVYMGALDPIAGKGGWQKLWKGLGVVLLVYGALLLIGTASGGRDPLAPLDHLRFAGGGTAAQAHLQFKTIKTAADLDRELAAAGGRPVLLDFYADWCVSCKEFEKYTFSDPDVIAALQGTVLLQADVTANDDADQALLRRFGLIGPPAILFFDTAGEERKNYRVVGFMKPEQFRPQVEAAFRR
ncbi:MAG: protein-disulfide reductase DsbD [Thiohalomonadaceae bacterium]